MAASADGSILVTVTGNLKNTLNDGQIVTATAGVAVKENLANGTGASQFNRGWQSKGRALTSGASEDIDLYDLGSLDIGAGAGEDGLGLGLTATAVVCIVVTNNTSSVGNLVFGGKNTAAAWNSPFGVGGSASDTAQLILPPRGGVCLWAVGSPAFAVADTSNHLLTIAASGGAINYDIAVLFRG